jgi:hypothetical protein
MNGYYGELATFMFQNIFPSNSKKQDILFIPRPNSRTGILLQHLRAVVREENAVDHC